jgi:hypothetical protein
LESCNWFPTACNPVAGGGGVVVVVGIVVVVGVVVVVGIVVVVGSVVVVGVVVVVVGHGCALLHLFTTEELPAKAYPETTPKAMSATKASRTNAFLIIFLPPVK